MTLPHDYTERVYAGVLGKIIGVYLGRPFEGWSYERIMAELDFAWRLGGAYALSLPVEGTTIRASVDGQELFVVADTARPLTGGGVALVIEEGRVACEEVAVASG